MPKEGLNSAEVTDRYPNKNRTVNGVYKNMFEKVKEGTVIITGLKTGTEDYKIVYGNEAATITF